MRQAIPRSPMIWIGATVIVAVGFYFAFTAVNGVGLSSREAAATVVAREHREQGTTYKTKVIGGRTRAVPQVVPGAYLLELELEVEGRRVQHPVPKSVYEGVEVGDRLSVTYRKQRLTGDVRVESVSR